MLRFAEKKINLQQVFSEKICSVVYTLILVVLWHLKTNLAKCTHFYISFTIVSDFSKFHFEVETFKKTLHKNAYPTKFDEKCVEKFVNNIFIQNPVFITVPKLELVLPIFREYLQHHQKETEEMY